MQQIADGRLEREIGRGAYGTVYLAVMPDGERAAVKVCRRDDIGDERYQRELRGAKLYRSIPPQEGLVRMRNLVETDCGFYTVMDLADDEFGGSPGSAEDYRPKTLASVIKGEKALPLKECVKLAIALAEGLAALQRHHLLHRDIKPGNVLYVKGRPVLSDPGLLVEESDASSRVGTPGYVPPEKFADAASDIYSLGLTLKAASFGRQLEDIDKGPAMEADTGDACFPAWWRILNKATDPVPSRRYQSAKALLKDLRKLYIRMGIGLPPGVLRLLKVALFAVIALAFALTVWNVIERMRGIDDTLNMTQAVFEEDRKRQAAALSEMRARKESEERSRRDSFWKAVDAERDELRNAAKAAVDGVKGDIADMEVIDVAKAAKFRSGLERIAEIDAQEVSVSRKIDELREKAGEKMGTGLDDKEEYLQAQELRKDRDELHKTLLGIADELSADKKEILERVNRDWFWDLHGSMACSLNSQFARDCIKRSIALIKARFVNGGEYVRSLYDRLEKFARDEGLHALARNEFTHLLKRAEEKGREGLDCSAELLQMQWRLFDGNFYFEHLQNITSVRGMLNISLSNYVDFDYRYYDARAFCLNLEPYMEVFRHEILMIAADDKAKGDELMASFDRLGELLAKGSSCQRDIDLLHEKAKEKRGKGLDDEEEFLLARKIAKDTEKAFKEEIKPLVDKLYNCILRNLPKESRWDAFYNYRHHSYDVEVIRRGIAEVSSLSEKAAADLQSQLDILVAGNARAAPLQREIDLLRKISKEKLRKGQDDTEEYRQACRAYDKERGIYIHEIGHRINYGRLNQLMFEVRRGALEPIRWRLPNR